MLLGRNVRLTYRFRPRNRATRHSLSRGERRTGCKWVIIARTSHKQFKRGLCAVSRRTISCRRCAEPQRRAPDRRLPVVELAIDEGRSEAALLSDTQTLAGEPRRVTRVALATHSHTLLSLLIVDRPVHKHRYRVVYAVLSVISTTVFDRAQSADR